MKDFLLKNRNIIIVVVIALFVLSGPHISAVKNVTFNGAVLHAKKSLKSGMKKLQNIPLRILETILVKQLI